MSDTRASHEKQAYKEALYRSIQPGAYMTAADVFATNAPTVRDMQMHPRSLLVDVDSDVMGITRKLGHCVESQYSPDTSVYRDQILTDVEITRNNTRGEDCRMSNPPCTLRCHGINRWQWLCQDPQRTAISPIAAPVDYRSVSKDNHRPIIPKHIDLKGSLPTPTTDEPSWLDGKADIEAALRDLPDKPVQVHWRDIGEVKRICGAF